MRLHQSVESFLSHITSVAQEVKAVSRESSESIRGIPFLESVCFFVHIPFCLSCLVGISVCLSVSLCLRCGTSRRSRRRMKERKNRLHREVGGDVSLRCFETV